MSVRRRLTALLGLGLFGSSALVAAGPAAAATTVQVVEFNAADGKACTSRCLAPVTGLLGADVIALQEVCQDDLADFAGKHGLRFTFSAQSTADTVCHGHDRGNAVLSRHALDPIAPVRLTAPRTPTTNVFTLLCAIVHKPGQRLRACSTHLVSGKSPDQAGQARQILAATAGARRSGQKVIVAGDFNARPGDRTVAIMSGPFVQKHPAGIGVVYVWFHGLGGLTARAADGGSSDHQVLVSTGRV